MLEGHIDWFVLSNCPRLLFAPERTVKNNNCFLDFSWMVNFDCSLLIHFQLLLKSFFFPPWLISMPFFYHAQPNFICLPPVFFFFFSSVNGTKTSLSKSPKTCNLKNCSKTKKSKLLMMTIFQISYIYIYIYIFNLKSSITLPCLIFKF